MEKKKGGAQHSEDSPIPAVPGYPLLVFLGPPSHFSVFMQVLPLHLDLYSLGPQMKDLLLVT